MATSPTAGLDLSRRRFSVDDYETMFEIGILTEDDRVELIDGEIVEMPPIGSLHASHVDKMAALLRRLEPSQALLRVQSPVALRPDSQPEPDISLLKPRDDYYRDAHPTPEDIILIVEVAETTAEFDRETKVPLYARHGVAATWLVDLEHGRLELYEEPVDGEYTLIRRPPAATEIHPPGLEDVSFPAGECFIES